MQQRLRPVQYWEAMAALREAHRIITGLLQSRPTPTTSAMHEQLALLRDMLAALLIRDDGKTR